MFLPRTGKGFKRKTNISKMPCESQNGRESKDFMERKVIRCDYCKRKLNSVAGLKMHLKVCRKAESAKCSLCLEVVCKCFVPLETHTHHNQKPPQPPANDVYIKCPTCKSLFTTEKGVEYHLPNCKGNIGPKIQPKKTCVFCGSESYIDLPSHVFSEHPESLMFVCPCKTVVLGQKSFEDHTNICGVFAGKLVYACEICDAFQTNSKQELFQHKQTMHPSGVPPIMILPTGFTSETLQTDLPVIANVASTSTSALEIPELKSTPIVVGSSGTRKSTATSNNKRTRRRCPRKVPKIYDDFDQIPCKCENCGMKFDSTTDLKQHGVHCDGKTLLIHDEYNVEEKDCAFLLGL